MDNPIPNFLAQLRIRPAMYIGKHSVEALFMFLCGYSAAIQDQTKLDLAQYRSFIESLYAKYGYGGGRQS
jgi:hypothetical protein